MQVSRKSKVAQVVGKELGNIMLEMFKQQGEGIVFTLQACTITSDLSVLRAYYTFFGSISREEMANLLENNIRVIRKKLSTKIKNEFRIMPEIRFIYDTATEEQNRIGDILKGL